MRATVVVLTKLPDHLPVKTRLAAVLGEARARDLYLEMLRETLTIVPEAIVAYSPADAETDLPNARPVQGDDGATCLENALADAYEGKPLVALGGDAPDLPRARIETAVEMLGDYDAVFVPTPDGGFSCLALRAPVPGLAQGFEYGEGDALMRLRAFLDHRGLSSLCLEPWPDIDTIEDLTAYRKRARWRAVPAALAAIPGVVFWILFALRPVPFRALLVAGSVALAAVCYALGGKGPRWARWGAAGINLAAVVALLVLSAPVAQSSD